MTTKFDVEKFSGKNDFGLWRIKMRALLVQQGLISALESDKKFEAGSSATDEKGTAKEISDKEERERIKEKAHSAIILCLGDKVLREVARETSAAAVWAKLEGLYMTKSLANRLFMKQRLYSYKFAEGKGIEDQLEEFNKSVDDLENIDVKIEDEDKAILLLNALPKSFDHLKDAMLFGRDNNITLEEVQSALRAKELQKHNEVKREPAGEGLNVKKFKAKFKKQGHEGKKSKTSGGKDSEVKETRKCHYCKKTGHLRKDCFEWKKKQAEKGVATSSADIAEEIEDAELMNVTSHKVEDAWILDSGCSYHMCPNLDWFVDYKKKDLGSVLLGNDQVCNVQGIGSIRLKMHDGSLKILTEVRHIPQLKRNLISLGTLESKGFSFNSRDGCLYVMKGESVMMKAIRKSSLYYLCGDTIVGESGQISKDDSMLWHARLGHVSEKGMNELIKQKAIHFSSKFSLDKCEQCIMSKSKKQPFPVGRHFSKSVLDYAHSDLWGPSRVETIGGSSYFLSIIDDYSRKLWVYLLRNKSDAFEKFKEWCKQVEVEKGKSLKCLRTDNGLEFLSTEFLDFCKLKGMKRHRSVPGNPQQNGVVERMNRTILERVRCMLLSSGVLKKFWGEAVSTAAVLINKCPSAAIENQTPDERWSGQKSEYSNLKVFGCQAYAHHRQDKLEARALRCVFLGYQSGVKGYRL